MLANNLDAPLQLGEKAGGLTDGRLKDELQNTKDKAPYVQVRLATSRGRFTSCRICTGTLQP